MGEIFSRCFKNFHGVLYSKQMAINITKVQKQQLGNAIADSGFSPADFVYAEIQERKDSTNRLFDVVVLTCRDTNEKFTFQRKGDSYVITYDIPGITEGKDSSSLIGWQGVLNRLGDWAVGVKQERDAVDPWAQDAEDLANDDSYFTIAELPSVDHAIDESIAELKKLAIQNGKELEEIQGELASVATILKNNARTSTKKEWMAIFKGIVIEKLIDWGMQAGLFSAILHTLIDSVQDIAQLVHHASNLIPG